MQLARVALSVMREWAKSNIVIMTAVWLWDGTMLVVLLDTIMELIV